MVTETKDRKVNTAERADSDAKRMPHERDESPDDHDGTTRGVMRQAADDLAQGLVDTDLHGMRGVEQAAPAGGQPGQARPRPDAADGMRGQASTQRKEDDKQ